MRTAPRTQMEFAHKYPSLIVVAPYELPPMTMVFDLPMADVGTLFIENLNDSRRVFVGSLAAGELVRDFSFDSTMFDWDRGVDVPRQIVVAVMQLSPLSGATYEQSGQAMRVHIVYEGTTSNLLFVGLIFLLLAACCTPCILIYIFACCAGKEKQTSIDRRSVSSSSFMPSQDAFAARSATIAS